MFLSARNIQVVRSSGHILNLPDITIEKSAQVMLLGDSGSGKTTLLSVLSGLLEPSHGDVIVDGRNLFEMRASERDYFRGQRIGFVFQSLHLLPSLTLSQNILLAADMAGVKVEDGRLDYLLSTLGLMDKAARKPSALSQGEMQRAAVARAVLLKPDIIMADEPTSALDDKNAMAVIGLLESQAKEVGAALIVATHDARIKNRFEQIIDMNALEAA